MQLPDPVHLRLERSLEHAAELGQLLSDYAEQPPFRVTTRAGGGSLMVDRAELVVEPPRRAAMLVSDAVHQARAALDNLVNALRPAGPASGVYFPIRAKESDYAKALGDGALRGVPDWARAAIRALQPFETQDTRRWAGDQLLHLHLLARIDRHRLPPIHAAVVLPDYATGDATAPATARMHGGGQWAEWKYDPAHSNTRMFRAEILFGPDAGQPDGVDVSGWTRYLIERAAFAVQVILQSNPGE
jgi:hypothetical protein